MPYKALQVTHVEPGLRASGPDDLSRISTNSLRLNKLGQERKDKVDAGELDSSHGFRQ